MQRIGAPTFLLIVGWCMAIAAGAPRDGGSATQVYSADFTTPPTAEWSSHDIAKTPKGARPFLGPFGGESTTLRLMDLPEHRLLQISFALFVINPVDGSSRTWGPDVWDLTIVDGPTLLHTTFDNCGFFSDNNEQAFPDEFPCKPYPGWTGAAEKQTLGYIHSWGGPDRTFDTSSIYHLTFTFPHSAKTVAANFTSFSTEDKNGEAWGLANFRVATLSAADHLDAAALDKLWAELGSADPVKAFAAKWKFVASPDDASPYLRAKLRCDGVDEQKIASLINQLGDADPAARKQAMADLANLGPAAQPSLLKHILTADAPEAHLRISQLLEAELITGDDAEQLRQARALHALEVIMGLPNDARHNRIELPPPANPPVENPPNVDR